MVGVVPSMLGVVVVRISGVGLGAADFPGDGSLEPVLDSSRRAGQDQARSQQGRTVQAAKEHASSKHPHQG